MPLARTSLLLLAALAAASCQRAQKSHYALGAHECSMIPEEYVCQCKGKERPPTEDERLKLACGAIYTMCEGEVSHCRLATQSTMPWRK